MFERTLRIIASDFPQATLIYKRSSFVVGAQEMVMQYAPSEFKERLVFARCVDEIRESVFPIK